MKLRFIINLNIVSLSISPVFAMAEGEDVN
jgi:hypothetical protein